MAWLCGHDLLLYYITYTAIRTVLDGVVCHHPNFGSWGTGSTGKNFILQTLGCA